MDVEKLRILRDLAADRTKHPSVKDAEAVLQKLKAEDPDNYKAAKALGRIVRIQKTLAKRRRNEEGGFDERLTPESRRKYERWLDKECGNLAAAAGFGPTMEILDEMGVNLDGR